MDNPQICEDDLLDVVDIADKMYDAINEMLQDFEKNLAISAMTNVAIDIILDQSETIEDVFIFKKVLVDMFEMKVKDLIKQKGLNHPLS